MKRIPLLLLLAASAHAQTAWRFAVSGDSRNCGDVVMPLIARGALKDGASFYWHLGDFRKTYDFDEDMLAARGGKMPISSYLAAEWDDFIAAQLVPFGSLPVYLTIGNHELIPPKTRPEYVAQFADWLDAPLLRAQRLADDPRDHRLKPYFHWKQGGVDFIALDDASADQFDAAQLEWFEKLLARDKDDASVRGVVVGMHEALPNSLSCGHSMNESAIGVESGRRAYRDLLTWKAASGKSVNVLASHSHFVLENVYDTPFWKNQGVLPGWIVGTAGAIRYALPDALPAGAFKKTNVYGYLLGEVAADGKTTFAFKELSRADVPSEVVEKYGVKTVDDCFTGNADPSFPPPPPSCFDK